MQSINTKKSFLRSFRDGFKNVTLSNVIFASLFSLATGLAFGGFFINLVVDETVSEQHHIAKRVLDHSSQVEQSFAKTFKILNAANFANCHQENMEIMRNLLFQEKFIKNIGFIKDGKVVCSAARGNKEHPIGLGPLVKHQKPNGILVVPKRWLKIFGNTYQLDIFRRGNYSILYDFLNTEKLVPPQYKWQLTHEFDNEKHYLAGLADMPKHNSSFDVWSALGLSVPREKMCEGQTQQCITIEISQDEFRSQQLAYVLLLLFAVVLIVIVSIFCVLKLFNWRNSMGFRVKQAFKKKDFYCLYQPVVDIKSGNIIGVEVLARMRENGCEISPVDFIPSISSNGLSWPFTNFIVSKALEELVQIKSIDNSFKVAFNVFPSDVENGIIREFSEILGVSSFKGQMMIEVTESEFLEGVQAQSHLNELSEKGYSLAIDDFGTGYSNMQQLGKIKCDVLKIDRNFVSAISTNENFSLLISHMVDIARSANMKVVAEGIENEEQLKAIASLGIEYGQGFLFGQPTAIDEIVKLLKQNANKPKLVSDSGSVKP